jgi:hypothetical protein
MYGPLQGLLNSFCTKTPEGWRPGSYGVNMNPSLSPVYGYTSERIVSTQKTKAHDGCAPINRQGDSGDEVNGEAQDGRLRSESPPRIDVDQSGYESSESSVYDVLSDDDDYNNTDAVDRSVLNNVNNIDQE